MRLGLAVLFAMLLVRFGSLWQVSRCIQCVKRWRAKYLVGSGSSDQFMREFGVVGCIDDLVHSATHIWGQCYTDLLVGLCLVRIIIEPAHRNILFEVGRVEEWEAKS